MKWWFKKFIRSCDLIAVKQDDGKESLTHMNNNAWAHVYTNSSVDFKHKGLVSLFLYILVEN